MFNQSQSVTSGDKSQITYAEREDCSWAGAHSEVRDDIINMHLFVLWIDIHMYVDDFCAGYVCGPDGRKNK